MANRSRLSIAKPKIESYFDKVESKVFTPRQLEFIFSQNKKDWVLAQSTRFTDFIEYLISKSKLKKIDLKFHNKAFIRYAWDSIDNEIVYDIALSLKPGAYLSHYTAMFYHDLTEQIPKTIYVTSEQESKFIEHDLEQKDIDQAFNKPVRNTNHIAQFGDYKITLLNGKHTNNTGVIKSHFDSSEVTLTNLERTLIDISVRPNYSGGILEVLKAYTLAKEKVSINKIKAYLQKIDFIYPYHQVIGFYLEKSGYPDERIRLLEIKEKSFDFYLAHNMDDTLYSKRWCLYYPKYLG